MNLRGSAPVPIVIVMLRQPRRSDRNESRTDPFWEFGSFGLTNCHGKNLLVDTEASGMRLAFAQGGPREIRLVLLTPPVTIRDHGQRREATWERSMPLRYDRAPVLIRDDGTTDVPRVRELVRGVRRSTWLGRFSSAFRSRKLPLPPGVAKQLEEAWNQCVAEESDGIRSKDYCDALPFPPPNPDRNRETTYRRLLSLAKRGAPKSAGLCRRSLNQLKKG